MKKATPKPLLSDKRIQGKKGQPMMSNQRNTQVRRASRGR